jgi:hypothetical protein
MHRWKRVIYQPGGARIQAIRARSAAVTWNVGRQARYSRGGCHALADLGKCLLDHFPTLSSVVPTSRTTTPRDGSPDQPGIPATST